MREIAYSRQAAALAGVAPTGHGFPLPNEMGEAPMNIVIAGGDTTVDEMIASTERGILVTRLWYIREVDPYEKIFTGMTRDGTFLVEGGKVTARRAQFPLQSGPDGDAVERGSAVAGGARVGRRDVRHGGAGDEGARLQLHRSDAVLGGRDRPGGLSYRRSGMGIQARFCQDSMPFSASWTPLAPSNRPQRNCSSGGGPHRPRRFHIPSLRWQYAIRLPPPRIPNSGAAFRL